MMRMDEAKMEPEQKSEPAIMRLKPEWPTWSATKPANGGPSSEATPLKKMEIKLGFKFRIQCKKILTWYYQSLN